VSRPRSAQTGLTPQWRAADLIGTGLEYAFQVNATYEIRRVTPALASALGWRPDEIVGHSTAEFLHPDDLAYVLDVRERVAAGEDHVSTVLRLRTSSGEYRRFSVVAHPILNAGEVVVGAYVSCEDDGVRTPMIRALVAVARGLGVLLHADDEESLLRDMCEVIVHSGGYLLCWYGRPDHGPDQRVLPTAVAGQHVQYLDGITITWGEGPLGAGGTGTAIRTQTTEVRNDLASDPSFAPWLDAAVRSGFGSSISIPVVIDDEVDGALMVYSQDPDAFDALEQEVLEGLVGTLGYGIARLRDERELKWTFTEDDVE
jgi:PAS domain S-box-containing protein